MEGRHRDIIHDCEEGYVNSHEDCSDAVEGHGSALALPRGCVTVSPTLALKEHPDQLHIEEHDVTFPPELNLPVSEYIAAKG